MTSDGFIVGQRIIYAAEYSLAGGATLIVWFDRDGNDANGHNCHSDAKRRIVTAKPGETILHKGEPGYYRCSAALPRESTAGLM